MTKEDGSLGDFVDGVQLQRLDQQSVQQAELAAQDSWREDNLWVSDDIGRAVERLGTEALVADAREKLHELPHYKDEQMVVRKINWIPDSSPETRDDTYPRLRAVYGHAVLLTDRESGVNGNFFGEHEDAQSAFYALGVAVEDEKSLLFNTLIAPDSSRYDLELYRLLTNNEYTLTVSNYSAAVSRKRVQNLFASVINDETEGRRHGEDGSYDLVSGMQGSFNRRMREIGEKPVESISRVTTQDLHTLLLGAPTTTDTSAPGYVDYLQPFPDWNPALVRPQLVKAFDTFLKTSTVVKRDSQSTG